MKRYLAIVEGPHDASFFGKVLRERKFKKIDQVKSIDSFWQDLIPTVFPDGPRLDHVVRFPDVYQTSGGDETSVAIIVAGGDSQIFDELRATLEAVDVPKLTGIAIVADADSHSASQRVQEFADRLKELNTTHGPSGTEGGISGIPGFPLPVPNSNSVAVGSEIRVGFYIFPDNKNPGTLDSLLLECAASSLSDVHSLSTSFVTDIAVAVSEDGRFKALRKPSGVAKASAGVIANVLFPGSALSAAVERGPWLDGLTGSEAGINAFRLFCDELFG